MYMVSLHLYYVFLTAQDHIRMEKFAVDLDKVLDEFEYNEG
jgi:hypothetical protein